MTVLALPFVLFGEEYALRILGSHDRHAWAVAAMGIVLLTADSLAPVPSSLVIVFVALKTGWIVGTIAGTLGLCGQVIGAAWFGRVALSRFTARVFGIADIESLRGALQTRLAVTLGCLRAVPLLAETSVVLAASLGISLWRIVRTTLLPNVAIAATYAIAAEAGAWVAFTAIVLSIVLALVAWRFTAVRRGSPEKLP